MTEEITATEAARRLGVTDKTLRRWIAQGKIKARHVTQTRLALNADDVASLAEQIDKAKAVDIDGMFSSVAGRLAEAEQRLLTLERQIAELEGRVETLEARPVKQIAPPSVATHRGDPYGLGRSRHPNQPTLLNGIETPEGLEIGTVFAQRHYPQASQEWITRRLQTLRESGRLVMVEGSYKLGRATARWALAADGRHQFYESEHERPGFEPCEDCPHDL